MNKTIHKIFLPAQRFRSALAKALFLGCHLGVALTTAFPLRAQELPAPWKQTDVGTAEVGQMATVAGTAKHAHGTFTLGGTMDLWGPADGSHFVWQPVQGDVVLVARVSSMDNPGAVGHAKASLCIRESLDGGSRCVALCITPGDGTQFTYRETTDAKTARIFLDVSNPKPVVPKGKFPCWLKLVRHGNAFNGYESLDGETWWLTGQIKLDFKADAIIGIASSSHTKDWLTMSVFDHVKLTNAGASADTKDAKETQKRFRSQLTTIGIDGTGERVVYETEDRIEAPNWSLDKKWLIFNSKGQFFRIAAEGRTKPELIPTGSVKGINNDHVLSPDGRTLYFSAGGHLYAVPSAGGQPRQISNNHAPERKFLYYLHGVSPDEKTLAYVGVEAGNKYELYTIPAAGGPDTPLAQFGVPSDGPEYSSDGQWIYFNSERDAKLPGHAQCYRMKPDGTVIQQLTHDERVNWFPHVSSDREWVVYISFPAGTKGHPANHDVILRRMKPDGSQQADLIGFNGGQGTINVNSWSPDSRQIAFVRYLEAAR